MTDEFFDGFRRRLLRRVRGAPDRRARRAARARGGAGRSARPAAAGHRRAVSVVPLAEGHLGDGGAAAGRATGASPRALSAGDPERRSSRSAGRHQPADRRDAAARTHRQRSPGEHDLPAIDDVIERIGQSLPRADHAAAAAGPRPRTRPLDASESECRAAALELHVRADPRAARSRDRRRHHSASGSTEVGTIVEASPRFVLPERSHSALAVPGRRRCQRGAVEAHSGRSSHGRAGGARQLGWMTSRRGRDDAELERTGTVELAGRTSCASIWRDSTS